MLYEKQVVTMPKKNMVTTDIIINIYLFIHSLIYIM